MGAQTSKEGAGVPAAALAYRPEVDGLRALAVTSVLLFHAKIGPFTGGFAGVDVFFVISGFLITLILLREQAEGRLTLAGFYARRARRILPALAFVALCCIPAALWLATAEELADFSRMLAATAAAGSNFVLAATTGYFDGAAEDRPLLHTWSLAVEEQFYFVFPLFLLLTARMARRQVAWLLGAAAVVSLGLAEWGWRSFTNANFYLAPGRAWELIAGCLCAFGVAGRAPWATGVARPVREVLALAGLVAIVAPFFLLGAHTATPSLALLPPVLGTAAVLLWGTRPLVAVGLVSYSAYLWHQPLLAFARMYLDAPLPLSWRLGMVALTMVLAVLTWRFIEQPFRNRMRATPPRVLLAGLAGSLALVLAGLVLHQAVPALHLPLPPQVKVAFAQPPRAKACFDVPYAHTSPADWCRIHPGAERKPSFLLFGDSHALQVLEAFEAAASAAGRTGLFIGFSGCPPLLETVPLTRSDQERLDCAALNQRVLELVKQQGIREVFLVAKWSYYTDFWNGSIYVAALGRQRGDPVTLEDSRSAFAAGFAATVDAYRAMGVRLHIVEQVPQQAYDPRAIYHRALKARGGAQKVIDEMAVPRQRHVQLQAFPASVFRSRNLPGVEVLNFDELFCDAERCTPGTAVQPYYTDMSHLSAAGAERLVPRLQAVLQRRP